MWGNNFFPFSFVRFGLSTLRLGSMASIRRFVVVLFGGQRHVQSGEGQNRAATPRRRKPRKPFWAIKSTGFPTKGTSNDESMDEQSWKFELCVEIKEKAARSLQKKLLSLPHSLTLGPISFHAYFLCQCLLFFFYFFLGIRPSARRPSVGSRLLSRRRRWRKRRGFRELTIVYLRTNQPS